MRPDDDVVNCNVARESPDAPDWLMLRADTADNLFFQRNQKFTSVCTPVHSTVVHMRNLLRSESELYRLSYLEPNAMHSEGMCNN